MTWDAIRLFFNGLNWQALAIKAGAALIVLMLTFGAGFYTGSQSTLKPFATAVTEAAPKAAVAQHAQDVKQGQAANAASKAGDASAKAGDVAVKPIIKYIHDTNTVYVQGPPVNNVCPEPTIALDVLQKLNEAGHQ